MMGWGVKQMKNNRGRLRYPSLWQITCRGGCITWRDTLHFGGHKTKKMKVILLALEGEALSWWESCTPSPNWVTFKNVVLGHFQPNLIQNTYDMLIRGHFQGVEEILEGVKLKSWLWLSGRGTGFDYPISSWYTNSRGCLGLLHIWNLLVQFLYGWIGEVLWCWFSVKCFCQCYVFFFLGCLEFCFL